MKTRWLPEFTRAMQKEMENKKDEASVVGVLCGTKADQMFAGFDLASSQSEEFKSQQIKINQEAEALVEGDNILKAFFRTSSLLGENVKNTFDFTIQKVLEKRKGIKL